MARMHLGQIGAVLVSGLALAGCADGTGGFGFSGAGGDGTENGRAAAISTRLVERDVEAPEVFALTDSGLWDGRPSLGGVWVAHADVAEPERVIIRNTATGKFVIGALFRRERDVPGPSVQVSSDAAAALGMLAGQPDEVSIVALRREEVAPEPPAPAPDMAGEIIEERPLEEVTASAAAAIAAAESGVSSSPPAAPPISATAPATAPAIPATLPKPFIQIGIFSVEVNANRAAEQLRDIGLAPLVKQESWQGKSFWRVIAGPATSVPDRAAMLGKIKQLGYPDAYAVAN